MKIREDIASIKASLQAIKHDQELMRAENNEFRNDMKKRVFSVEQVVGRRGLVSAIISAAATGLVVGVGLLLKVAGGKGNG